MWLTMTPMRLAIPRNAHEPEGHSHDPESGERPHQPVGNGGDDDEGLHRELELDDQREEDERDRDTHHHREVLEAFDLLFVLAADFHDVARRKARLELLELGWI